MKIPFKGAVDCDLHLSAPRMSALLPYMDEYWSDQFSNRHIDRFAFTMSSDNPILPLQWRPDWKAGADEPGSELDRLRSRALDQFGSSIGIVNVIHGAIALYHGDMAAAILRAVNDWTADKVLSQESRLRGSILVSLQDPALAVAEIERLAGNPGFVQVLLPVIGELTIGRRIYWPVFEAASRAGLPICLHAGSLNRHAPTGVGWPSYYVEDYVSQSAGFEASLVSLLAEGVFQKFPDLTFVLAESGVTWMPSFQWRQDKMWLGVRTELPWIDRMPREIIRERVRLTLQPFDAPPDAAIVERLLDHLGSDEMLLFSTDYPHWHFDGDDVVPDGFPTDLLRKIAIDNPHATYGRLRQGGEATKSLEVTA
ncbi:amidohydrolase family protein [Rhodopseudomonas sp. B29]|uniref:amidohydrolase family protein n=1 Tax=Rhodopseudomonas sp. B29 TaxID=95607 RepID=UPI000344F415|nr:amidohydrolase family protein [Rhodopseudomonas sp. B29]